MSATDDVKAFLTAMGAPEDMELRKRLVLEETDEVLKAFADLVKELNDLYYVTIGLGLIPGSETWLTPAKTQFAGLIIAAIGEAFPGMLNDTFDLVHAANMSKLGEDGKPVRREDGKIMKGPNYKAPDILGYIEDGINEAELTAMEVTGAVN